MPIFFIPARGRKLTMLVGELDLRDDFLYPREGTETNRLCQLSHRDRFSSSPRGATIPNKNRHFCHPSIYKQRVVC